MTKGSDNSPKLNRPNQDNSWRDVHSQDENLNNSNRVSMINRKIKCASATPVPRIKG